jgi:hypothetical protein
MTLMISDHERRGKVEVVVADRSFYPDVCKQELVKGVNEGIFN